MTSLPSRLSLALAFALIALPTSAQESPQQKKTPLPSSTPWNLEELRKVPHVEWQESGTTRSLFYAGEPFEGKPTRVFACYATPGTLSGDPTKDKNLPGIVLVHGGGGKAFPQWAELWASRGYAAIAMDLSGSGKPHQPRTDSGPRQKDDVIFRTDAPATDQWSYHAVASVIRDHADVVRQWRQGLRLPAGQPRQNLRTAEIAQKSLFSAGLKKFSPAADNVHFSGSGCAHLAKKVTATLEKAIEDLP